MVRRQLSVISYQLSVISYQLSVISSQEIIFIYSPHFPISPFPHFPISLHPTPHPCSPIHNS
ncbi:MAG: hypothetical protein EWV92_08200 [Microcystis aeruginosa Ma_MB_S_20031200_S102]|uniref:Uncharacterized protein n=1 Tax=Microcystis aeruginosa Ma_MB_S_20031200_S102 TaxID=2486254 RepID=A0A552EVS8_MICAE|nr:MAG: hypothetical protein EWV79_06930 [Microcystis aeruginosa Ma_MB_S_20031200_S102D]TRU38581.1 MAG: hypothetical protein EWV92_08200 [Microcystis aeruginosa Ma_MB_S_20031200_S102]